MTIALKLTLDKPVLEWNAIDARIDLVPLFLEAGYISQAEITLNRVAAVEMDDEHNEMRKKRISFLREDIKAWRLLEEKSGGPGSLANAEHPIIKGAIEAIAEARRYGQTKADLFDL